MSFTTSLWHGDMNSVLKKHCSFVISYSQPGFQMCAGSSIRACRSLGRHIVALEPDVELFEQVLVPLLPTPKDKSSDSRRDPSPPQ